jgi:hypothetical protein
MLVWGVILLDEGVETFGQISPQWRVIVVSER